MISQVVYAQKIMPFLTSGNAKIAGESRLLSGRRAQRPSRYVYVPGIEKDLNMHGFDFNIALTVFYIFVRPLSSLSTPDLNKYSQYIAAEVPSNLALKHFGSAWLAGLVAAFGIVSIGTAFVKSFAGLVVTRVFLGIAEGGTLVR